MADFYVITGGGNWGTVGTWSSTPNQAVGDKANIPTSNDYVYLEEYGGALVVNTDYPDGFCKRLICSHANANITFSPGKTLCVTQTITLFAGMSYSGTGTLVAYGTGTLTANGVIVTGAMQFWNNSTFTFAGDWHIMGLVSLIGGSAIYTGAGKYVYADASITLGAASGSSGTVTFVLSGAFNIGAGANWAGLLISASGSSSDVFGIIG